jgi:UDP-N-acetylmuramate dehydrogenase
MVSLNEIQSIFRGEIALHEPLAKYTSMHVGGPADYYLEPKDKEDLARLVGYLQQNKVPFLILGRGSNLLVSDEGVRGVVINLESGVSRVYRDGEFVVAESGCRLNTFTDFCIQNELAGVEMLAGIPGTIGGAVVMNAGAHGGEIADHLVQVEAIRDGAIVQIKKSAASFAYRKSGFGNDVVLSATFLLPPGRKEELFARRRELILKRNASQPLELPNSGSMFKNPPNNFAARLIEQAGLKGKRVGDAQISEKHANFIVNYGTAKAVDVMKLIDLAQRTVYQNSGVLLELEVKLIGFAEQTQEHA